MIAARIDRAFVVPSPIRRDLNGILPWPDNPVPSLACVARLNPVQKGQDLLLEVLSQARWRQREWRLTLVGRGLGRTYLAELAAHYGIADRVTFAGFQHDMAKVWSSSQLLVLPSREESMPIAIMEAMICGRPCVVTDVGDNAMLIEHQVTGYVAAGDRPGALAAALEAAWTGRDDWEGVGARAHAAFVKVRDPQPGRTVLSVLTSCSQRGSDR
jgi:glycosyltransferase involved in cell wall biosynthesis